VANGPADPKITAELRYFLDELSDSDDWAALAAVLRRVIDGERGTDLLAGLELLRPQPTRW
jgi:hypothetical protein